MKERKKQILKPYFCFGMVILLLLFSGYVSASEVDFRYVIDGGNWLDEEVEENMKNWLAENYQELQTELVVVTTAQETLSATEDMEQQAEQLAALHNFGSFEGEEYGAVFLFLNQIPSTKQIQMAVVPIYQEKYNCTVYQTIHIAQKLEEAYAKNSDLTILLPTLWEWIQVYYYPIINELGPEYLSQDTIIAASNEIALWRENYDENIILLLNEGFAPGLYERYADDYFLSQGYGVGEKESGVFLIYDKTTGKFDLRFYGTASKQYTQEQLDDLVKEIAGKLEGYDVLNIVYAIERFLDPEADVPLVQRNIDELEGFFPDNLYVRNDQNILSTQEADVLYEKASSFQILFGHAVTSFVFHSEEITEQDMQETATEMFQQLHGDSSSGLAVFLDPVAARVIIESIGDLKESIEENKEAFNKVTEYLKKQLEKAEYTGEAMVRHQLSLMDYLATIHALKQSKYLIDEGFSLYELDFGDQVMALQKAGLQTLIIRKNDHVNFKSAKDWLKQYRKIIELAGLGENMVLLVNFADQQEIEVAYFGKNREIQKLIESEIGSWVEQSNQEEGTSAAISTFLNSLEEKAIPLLKDNSGKGAARIADSKAGDLVAQKLGINSGILWIIIISGVIVVIVILILVLIFSGKKKKSNQSRMPMQPNSYQPMNSSYGYGQPYSQVNGQPQFNQTYGQPMGGYGQAWNVPNNVPNGSYGQQAYPAFEQSDSNQMQTGGQEMYNGFEQSQGGSFGASNQNQGFTPMNGYHYYGATSSDPNAAYSYGQPNSNMSYGELPQNTGYYSPNQAVGQSNHDQGFRSFSQAEPINIESNDPKGMSSFEGEMTPSHSQEPEGKQETEQW